MILVLFLVTSLFHQQRNSVFPTVMVLFNAQHSDLLFVFKLKLRARFVSETSSLLLVNF